MKVSSPRSGEIRMSAGRREASCARTFCSVRMLIVCAVYPSTDDSWSAGHERRADVDRDDDVRSHRAHDVDRQVVDEAAVAKYAAVDFRGREHSRHRHAGAHRLVDRTPVEDDFAARLHVGGDRAERNGQLVERRDVVDAPRQFVQERLEVAAGQRALEGPELPVAEADLEGERELRLLLLVAKAHVAPRRRVREQRGPAHRRDLLLHFSGRHAAGVQPADDRAHRRRRDVVDRNAHLLQHLQHADVGDAARAAAGQHESDFRARFGRSLRSRSEGGAWPLADKRETPRKASAPTTT